jgi:hypothetical protein
MPSNQQPTTASVASGASVASVVATELGALATAVGGIWASVVAISVFAPDMVSGSEHEHLPVAAFGTWIWGAVATSAVVTYWARLRAARASVDLYRPLAFAVAAIWAAAAVVAVFSPEMVTGSDPTRIPFGALVAPVAATVLTVLARGTAEYLAGVLDAEPLSPAQSPAGVRGL